MQSASDQKLISIERVVAFVVGPIVTAASAAASAWLSTKVGVHVTSASISTSLGTGGLVGGALAWKWLHGRQASQAIENDLARWNATPMEGGITVGLKDLEGLAQSAANKAAAAITNAADGTTESPPPAAVAPIPAASDPAPAGQGAAEADAGAASGQ